MISIRLKDRPSYPLECRITSPSYVDASSSILSASCPSKCWCHIWVPHRNVTFVEQFQTHPDSHSLSFQSFPWYASHLETTFTFVSFSTTMLLFVVNKCFHHILRLASTAPSLLAIKHRWTALYSSLLLHLQVFINWIRCWAFYFKISNKFVSSPAS